MFRKTLRWIFKEDFDQEIQTQMIVMRQLKNERDSYVDQNMELCNRMCDMKRRASDRERRESKFQVESARCNRFTIYDFVN